MGNLLLWKTNLKMVGWFPLIATVLVLIALFNTSRDEAPAPFLVTRQVLETVLPLAIALHAAFLFSPDDEPSLEILLSFPRSMIWLLMERLAMLWIMQGVIGVGVTFITMQMVGETDVIQMLLRWIPPTVFLSSVGIYTTLRSRRAAFGAAVAGLLWFFFCFFSEGFVPGYPTVAPFNLLQIVLWPLNLYLPVGSMFAEEYIFNRVFIVAAGVFLLVLSFYLLRDDEYLLLAVKAQDEE